MRRPARPPIEVMAQNEHGYSGVIHFGCGSESARWDRDGHYLDGGPWYDGRLDIEPWRYTRMEEEK